MGYFPNFQTKPLVLPENQPMECPLGIETFFVSLKYHFKKFIKDALLSMTQTEESYIDVHKVIQILPNYLSFPTLYSFLLFFIIVIFIVFSPYLIFVSEIAISYCNPLSCLN